MCHFLLLFTLFVCSGLVKSHKYFRPKTTVHILYLDELQHLPRVCNCKPASKAPLPLAPQGPCSHSRMKNTGHHCSPAGGPPPHTGLATPQLSSSRT